MDTRKEMLRAAEAQLQASPDFDISTRAVCDAVGVGAPVLYRLFGDKNGLLSAVIDRAFRRYLASKRAQALSHDPVADLYSAWDAHVAFALKNQAVYRIAYGPALKGVPTGVEEARQLLVARLVRCAEVGKLSTPPDTAAQIMMAACAGVALSLMTQPETFDHPALSHRVRDAVLRDLLADAGAPYRNKHTLKSVALQMATMIKTTPTPLTEPEVSLMLQWLGAVATSNRVSTGAKSKKV
ncbi:TetR/AcrR family transcriptional regulator [Mycobacterium sp. URHB0021]